jgi:hypothetical protein
MLRALLFWLGLPSRFALVMLVMLTAGLTNSSSASAQSPSLELVFTPIDRAQIAVWVEREDGTFMGTLALTYAVAKAGIGNRPGALQFNSGFRWPYGRREGVLPVWAHRRVTAPGARMWKRVIFQQRDSEGDASRTTNDMSPDNYYCLSFGREKSALEALDAVTCASVFSSDKGRFITDTDLQKNYGEPFEDRPGAGRTRTLDLTSFYPPRRDVERCTQSECYDHADLAKFRSHALEVMPELDAVTRATLQGRRPAMWTFNLPADWPKGERYKLFLEVNVEGDYNEQYSDKVYPTPKTPMGAWDSWAMDYGYPYRGQPSVVFELPFSLTKDNTASVLDPAGFGALQGEDGSISPMTRNISNDPSARMGSGADRLLAVGDARASLRVMTPDSPFCQTTHAPGTVQELLIEPDANKQFAHMWAHLSFLAPASDRPIGSYLVEIKADDSDWEQAYTPDLEQELLPVALDICADPERPGVNRCENMQPGTPLEATISGLRQSSHYLVRVTPRDRTCGEMGQVANSEITMPARTFATVTPCFVASAAYGSPLASEIGVLRALRDRHLANHALGRAFIELYYAVGPSLAEPVREHAWLASSVRFVLTPVVKLVDWWMR